MTRHLGTRQIMRRVVQLSVLAVILTVPAVARYNNYLAAHELDDAIEKWAGTAPGAVLAMIDRGMRALPGADIERAGRRERDRDQVLEYGSRLRGGSWSAEIGPLSMTDPLAAAEAIAASKHLPAVLVLSLVIPIVVTVLLGRVFCSWICPVGFLLEMTDKLRRVLRVLEVHPRNLRASRRIKYGVLLVGLGLAGILAVPVLGYVYPPAILARELHQLVFGIFDRAEMGAFGPSLQGLSWMLLIIGAIVLVEVTVSRRWWCRYVCPGGALYSLIGGARPVRVKLTDDRCTACAQCIAACPMGLNPMKNEMGMECDNCGVCIAACDDAALEYAIDAPWMSALKGAGGRPHEPA